VATLPIPITRQALTESVYRLRRPFTNIGSGISQDQLSTRVARFDVALAHTLYTRLLQPAEPYIKNTDRVIIVPQGTLFHLPFELLVKQMPGTAGMHHTSTRPNPTFALEAWPPMVYTLSATLFGTEAKNSRTPQTLLALINPVTALAPLHNTRKESATLRRLYGKHALVLTGAAASRQRFLAEAAHYDVIYIASHGEYDAADPMASGFWLSGSDGRGKGVLVTADDILTLSLSAQLVTFRACDVGLGGIQQGEGVVGLTSALKYAGAHKLVMSLWTVEDDSSLRLMTQFQESFRTGSAAAMLRRAKLRLRDSGRWANPFYWASSVLFE